MATHDINVNGTIANDAVTNAKLANAPEATFKLVPVGSGTSNPIDGDADQAMEILALATDPPLTAADLAGYVQDGQTLSTGLVFPYGGLRVKDNAGSQELAIVVGEDLTANRTLTLIVNDANKTLELTGDAEVEGVNTGDQDLSGLLTEADADLLYDPLTQNRADHVPGDMSFHYFSVYDTGEARSEKADGIAVKTWLAGEFDALGAAAAAQAASQPLDADLTAIAELTPSNDDIIQRKAGAWTNRSMSQLATDLAGGIRSTLLTGLSLASSAAVAATDSILEAFGKLQAFNNLFTTAGLAIARLANPGAVTFLRINADNTATARTAAEMRSDLDVPANAEAILKTFVAAKGDIIGGSANDTPAITSVGTDGQLLIANSANASGLGYAWKTFAQAWIRASTTISNIPAAITWLTGGTGTTRQQPYSLAGYTQIKIDVFVTTIFSGAGSGVLFRYRTSYSATETDYSEIGVGATDCKAAISAADWNTSGWVDITAAALTDVYIGLFTINGNGTSDPIITQVILSLR